MRRVRLEAFGAAAQSHFGNGSIFPLQRREPRVGEKLIAGFLQARRRSQFKAWRPAAVKSERLFLARRLRACRGCAMNEYSCSIFPYP